MKGVFRRAVAIAILLGCSMALFQNIALAADFDGTQALICSAFVAGTCDSGGTCDTGTAESVNFPEFFRIDFAAGEVQAILASGETRESTIERTYREGGELFLQGIENQRAWSAVLSEDDGRLTLAAAGERLGFMIFGACIVPVP